MVNTLIWVLIIAYPINAYAYIDPGTGSILIQILIGVVAVLAISSRRIYYRIKKLFGKKEEQIFLGREISQHRDYSELTAQKIDQEVSDIVKGAYKKTYKLLEDNLDTLHRMANALIEKETLEGSDLDEIISDVKQSEKQESEDKEG